MESDRVTIRIPPDLHAAILPLASGLDLSVGAWLRALAERETGVKADPKRGMAGASARAKRRAKRARWGR